MKKGYSVVETDNHGSDYPNESFVIRHLSKKIADRVADLINSELCYDGNCTRYYKVVEDTYEKPYELRPGFEP